MKRTFLARRNALLSPGSLSAGAIALVCAIVFLGFRYVLPGAFLTATAPFARAGAALASFVDTFTSGFQRAAALSQANEKLLQENAALSLENRTLVEKQADLFALLGVEGVPAKGIIAGVVTRPPQSAYDTYVLSAGGDMGVTLGMELFGPGGIPLGTISEVTNAFSRATLFSASGMRVPGWIGEDRLPVTLTGEGGGAFSAEVPRASALMEGAVVYISAPGAVPVGTVKKVGGAPSDPAMRLSIQPTLNIFSIPWVLVRESGMPYTVATSSLP